MTSNSGRRCAACGGRQVSNGLRYVRMPQLQGDKFARVDVPIRRYLCRTCGAVSEDLEEARIAQGRAAKEIVAAVARYGIRSTAERADLSTKTVSKWTQAWLAAQANPGRLPRTLSLRRVDAAESYLVCDEALRNVLLTFADDPSSLAQFIMLADHLGVENVLIEFDAVALHVLASAYARASVPPTLSVPRLDAILTENVSGMETAFIAETARKTGWNTSLLTRLRAAPLTTKSKMFLSAWSDAIANGLLLGDKDAAFTNWRDEPQCSPLRLAAMFACLADEAGEPSVSLDTLIEALREADASRRGKAVVDAT